MQQIIIEILQQCVTKMKYTKKYIKEMIKGIKKDIINFSNEGDLFYEVIYTSNLCKWRDKLK